MDAVWKDNLEIDRAIAPQRKTPSQTKNKKPARQVSFLSYIPLFLVAILKDTLDLLLGWIPGLGAIISFCFGVLIFMLLLLMGSGSLRRRGLAKKGLLLVIATMVGSILVVSMFMPEEMLAVIGMYILDKVAAKKESL